MPNSPFISILRAFHRNHPQLAIVIWTAVAVLNVFAGIVRYEDWTWSRVIGEAIGTLVAGIVVCAILAIQEAKFLAREEAQHDGAPVWDVTVNGISVGKLSDNAYAAILRSKLFDHRTYLAQLMNLLGCAFRAFDWLFLAIPIVTFWGVWLAYFGAPESLMTIASEIQWASLLKVRPSWRDILQVALALTGLALLCGAVVGKRFGRINYFDRAIATAIRQRFGVAAEGDVVLHRATGEQADVQCHAS